MPTSLGVKCFLGGGAETLENKAENFAEKICHQNFAEKFAGNFLNSARSLTFLAGHGEICPPTWVIYMATRRPAHNTPIHIDFLYGFLRYEVHVDRRVVGRSAGRHVYHPCGGKISPWSARKVTENSWPHPFAELIW